MTSTLGVNRVPTAARCCIAGGGPAGIVLGLLLARAGVDVIVLEKHHDFIRDFRGDTIHPSTLELMDALGLAKRLLQLRHSVARQFEVQVGEQRAILADFSRLKTKFPYLVFMPQWDLLDFLSAEAQRYPTFRLVMDAEVTDVIVAGGAVRGVRYRDPAGEHELRALLTVAADGRGSRVREAAGLRPVGAAPPMDVLWFRVSRRPDDPTAVGLHIHAGAIVVFINRFEYWQVALVIPKGDDAKVRAAGLAAFRERLRAIEPAFADRFEEVTDFEQVKLLVVQMNRLRRWYQPGLLCIGDAAHAMSPVGGVGINLAIQDAVAAANYLVEPLRAGRLSPNDLRRIQRRRAWPTRAMQGVQGLIQSQVWATLQQRDVPAYLPRAFGLLSALPVLRDLPAQIIGYGVCPVRVDPALAHGAQPRVRW